MASAQPFITLFIGRSIKVSINGQSRPHFFRQSLPTINQNHYLPKCVYFMESSGQEQHFPNKHIPPRHYKTRGQSETEYVRQRIKILMACINYTMGLLRIQFYSVRQSKTNIFYFLIHFLSTFNKNLVNLSLGDVQSRIHFRTNTFDI